MVTKMKVPPFVATLGMLYITKGLSLVVSQLKPIYFNDAIIFNQTAMDLFWAPSFRRLIPLRT